LPEKEDNVYLDVGANIGSSSIAVALRGLPVVAIEASSRTAARLNENVALNSPLSYTVLNIGVTSKELASKDRFLTLHTIRGNSGASSLVPGWAGRAIASAETTRLSTIDDIVRMLGSITVPYIKVDVEGYELNVLAGAQETLTTFRPVVLFEWRPDAMVSARVSGQAISGVFPPGYVFFSVAAVIDRDKSARLSLGTFDPSASVENVLAVPSELGRASPIGELVELRTAVVPLAASGLTTGIT
jgi:FkbM family methyltransferase